jgi:hypothetical protein
MKTLVHLILSCNYSACVRTLYVETSAGNGRLASARDDDFFMHPSRAIEPAHPSVPLEIANDWMEAQRVMVALAPKAAAVMFRRVLNGVLIDNDCKLHPLKQGVEQLIQSQRLPAIFDEWLPAIKDDGHDGAHPDRALNVSSDNVTETMEYTAELLRFLYIEPYEFLLRKARNTASASAPAE